MALNGGGSASPGPVTILATHGPPAGLPSQLAAHHDGLLISVTTVFTERLWSVHPATMVCSPSRDAPCTGRLWSVHRVAMVRSPGGYGPFTQRLWSVHLAAMVCSPGGYGPFTGGRWSALISRNHEGACPASRLGGTVPRSACSPPQVTGG